MGKHHRKPTSTVSKGFNLGDLLKNVDINQIVSLVSSLVGANNMTTGQLSSMLRNFDLSDLNNITGPNKLNENEVKSQLSALADRLDDVEKGQSNNVQEEVLNAVKALQSSPEGQDVLNSLLKGAFSAIKEDKKR
jgi:hypothetical protein